ncbi:hypothetical protein BDN67DRAFT_878858, partial [Paxillus ammoniavirescens]
RLIEWCKENESTRIRPFSDSTQDMKDAGWKKEVPGVLKKDYFQQLARQIFANNTNHELKTYSQSPPHLFTSRINCHVQDLCKKYNEVNSKLGQTGAGMSYEDLVANPSKSNIIHIGYAEKLVESFPWWPELHGWWRKNLAYNTAYCVADSGQNLAAEALLLFKRQDGG